MELITCPAAAPEWLDGARRRYPNRPLFCCLPRPPHLPPAGNLDLSASGPVEPGRSLLVRLQGTGGRSDPTVLVRVAGVARRANGSWLVRCQLAATPVRPQFTSAVA
jgi:hypothetical protein